MKQSVIAFVLVSVAACIPPDPDPDPTVVEPTRSTLAITPVMQETQVWCWVATAEMMFRHYQIPALNQASYQCGIIAAAAGPNHPCWYDCTQCIVGSGTDERAAQILAYYPQVVQQVFPQVRIPQLQVALTAPTTPAIIQREIDEGDPVELGVTPGGPFTGMAGHAVLVVGYDATAAGRFLVDINDPFPYDAVVGPAENPYRRLGAAVVRTGQYRIDFAQLQALQWSATIRVEPF